jgi:hypothetical protein
MQRESLPGAGAKLLFVRKVALTLPPGCEAPVR